VDDADEMIRVVRALLADDVLFAVIYQGDMWAGTTLVKAGQLPKHDPKQRAVLFSWSGSQDANIA
jgi:hypothetical protein